MNIKKFLFIIILAVLSAAGCGAPADENIILKGDLIIPDTMRQSAKGPLFVIVSKTDDIEAIENDPLNNILAVSAADKSKGNFSIDLKDSGVKPDDTVYIFAFADNDFKKEIPYPTTGDIVGFYINRETFKQGFILENGVNNVSVIINRVQYDVDATISGTLDGNEKGDVIVIGYAGEINSMDTNAINPDKIIAYTKLVKGYAPLDFSMKVLPYGFPLPIQNIYIIAIYDINSNGTPDSGDRIGFCTQTGSSNVHLYTITEGDNMVSPVKSLIEIPKPSGISLSISGHITLPSGISSDRPVYVAVARSSDPNLMLNDPVSCVKAFVKADLNDGFYNIDLSKTDLVPGEEVFIVAIWDLDYSGGLPSLTTGDYAGFYVDRVSLKTGFQLREGNQIVDLLLSRQMHNQSGEIRCYINSPTAGKVILIAYAGEISSLDFTNLDTEAIMGYTVFDKDNGPAFRTLPILPLGYTLPRDAVYIIALIDVNGNGQPDSGDKICYIEDANTGYPSRISLRDGMYEGAILTESRSIPEPSSDEIKVSGTFTPPAGYDAGSPPAFIIVARTDNPSQVLSGGASAIKNFYRVPAGSNLFTIDLSLTDLRPGDKVMVFAIWDRDYAGGLPASSPGDTVGLFINTQTMSSYVTLEKGTVTLSEAIRLDKVQYDYSASVTGNIIDAPVSQIILIAYAGNINSLEFSQIDSSAIMGYKKIYSSGGNVNYTLPIIPCGYNVPVQNVTILAVADINGDGLPDPGDIIGYHTSGSSGLPGRVTLNEGTTGGINIIMKYPIPSPSEVTMHLTGNFTSPSGYTSDSASGPIYIIAAKTDDPNLIFSNPGSVIRAFQRIPQGANTFSIDLTSSGLEPDDKVMVLMLWDKNFAGGFPSPDSGDKAGFYINTNIDAFSMVKTLAEGDNLITTSGSWKFEINKNIFNYSTSVEFKIDPLNRPSGLNADHNLIALLVHKSGVNDSIFGDYSITDINYVLGMAVMPYSAESSTVYRLNVLNAVDDRISSTDVMPSYLILIYDANGDGRPTSGENEQIAAYWQNVFLKGDVPKQFNLQNNKINILDTPSTYTVKFLNRAY